ncbi:MAG: hypothetical protein ACRELS_09740 [Candidatus Rokuibacteriota bacterium]
MACRLTASVMLVVGVVWAAWGEAGSPARQSYRSTDAQGNVIYSDRPGSGDVPAPAEGAVDAALVDELFRATGVDRRLPGLAAQIQAEFQRQSGLGATPERQMLSDIVARQFRPDTLYPMVRDEFLRAAGGGRTRDTLAWYRSPFGRRVVGLEIQAGTPESQREFRAYATSIGSNWPGSRVVLVRRLDDATRATETGLDSLVVMLRSFAAAVDAARPPEQRMDRSQLESQLKQTRDRAFGPTRQGALVAMLFTYRDLTESDLERYARFMESEAGSWYTRTLNRSLIQVVGVKAERTGAEVVRALPPERWQSPRAAGAAR